MENKIKIVVIAGPTASGKTAVATGLAKELDGEVVCADSMQIYKGMSIATAVPTKDEMCGVPHHLYNFASPEHKYSVADYVKDASEVIEDISARGKLPILCGGAGLYIDSLVQNVKFSEVKSDPKLREQLAEYAKTNDNEALWQKLFEIDPEYAKTLHPNNLVRVIRAIEVFQLTGIKMSEQLKQSKTAESKYNAKIFGLYYSDRNKLYERINLRVDKMIEQGLVEEARQFYKNYRPETSAQAIGYKELIPYFEGRQTLEECVDKIKQYTRNYAKRQLTWFRKNPKVEWIDCQSLGNCKKIVNNVLESLFKS